MLRKGIHPNTDSFNHLLGVFSASGSDVSATIVRDILSDMNRFNVPYDANTYLSAFGLFCRVGSEVGVESIRNNFFHVKDSLNVC